MYPFDLSGIVSRLRLNTELLYQANNQILFISRSWPTATWLSLQIGNKLKYCIDDVAGIITELEKWPSEAQYSGFGASVICSPVPIPEPLKAASSDPNLFQFLTVAECMQLANIEHSRQYIIQMWRCIEDQKKALIELAAKRKGQRDL